MLDCPSPACLDAWDPEVCGTSCPKCNTEGLSRDPRRILAWPNDRELPLLLDCEPVRALLLPIHSFWAGLAADDRGVRGCAELEAGFRLHRIDPRHWDLLMYFCTAMSAAQASETTRQRDAGKED